MHIVMTQAELDALAATHTSTQSTQDVELVRASASAPWMFKIERRSFRRVLRVVVEG